MGNKGSSASKPENRKHSHPELSHTRFFSKDNQNRMEATFGVAAEQ